MEGGAAANAMKQQQWDSQNPGKPALFHYFDFGVQSMSVQGPPKIELPEQKKVKYTVWFIQYEQKLTYIDQSISAGKPNNRNCPRTVRTGEPFIQISRTLPYGHLKQRILT